MISNPYIVLGENSWKILLSPSFPFFNIFCFDFTDYTCFTYAPTQ